MDILEKEKLQKSIDMYCQAKGFTSDDLSGKLGLSKTTISNIRNGKWSLLSDHRLRSVANMINTTILAGLYETTDVQSVWTGLEKARKHRLMIGITGDTGLGKSTSCKAYTIRTEVFYYEYNYGDSPKTALIDILREMGVKYEGTVTAMLSRLCEELNYMENPLLIIDECSKLKEQMIMMLHSLRNRTQHNCGIALVGMPYFKNNLIREVNKETIGYAEFYRRIQMWHELRGLMPEEITYVLENNGITDKATQNSFRKINRFGDLMNAITLHKSVNE